MSKIEWTGETWNPITGCTKISAGCKHCYAETMANRLKAMGARGYENGFKLTVQSQDAFDKPLKRKKPTTYFVCSMSDLFQDGVDFETIDRVMDVIKKCPQHTFQILTKRAKRMADYFWDYTHGDSVPENVWLGVTCENQETANERIPHLLSIDAPVRFLSIEPMLGQIDIFSTKTGDLLIDKPEEDSGHIDWMIVGGESGKDARPMHPDWARSIRDQCAKAHHPIPFFFKQMTSEKGRKIPFENVPIDLQIRKTPLENLDLMDKGSHNSLHILERGRKDNGQFEKKVGRLLDGVLHDAMPEVKNG